MDAHSHRGSATTAGTDSSPEAPVATRPASSGLCLGHPRFRDPDLAALAARDGAEAAWRAGYRRFGPLVASRVEGDFAVAIREGDGSVLLAVDRFSIETLCYRLRNGELEFAGRADALAGPADDLDAQAIFNYLYFHMIPAPATIFPSIRRLPAGHFAHFDDGKLIVAPWWTPEFKEVASVPFEEMRREFRRVLVEAVERQIHCDAVGCFLSGGTDSSTVAGLLGEVTAKPARTFSIGFDADGYDEMEYARIAARHFKTDHHEYYVTPDDLVGHIPAMAASFDQPFGNSSIMPAFLCARLAREAGVDQLLAGDGGDELFGGNVRYAKQRVFDLYEHVPRVLRSSVLEPALFSRSWARRVPGLKKAASYVEQARVPLPDRLEMYNLLMRVGLTEVLTPEFLDAIDPDEPLRQQRSVYAANAARSTVNRLLAFDWRFTLAENDLRKVAGATSLAGISVAFPLLDDRLVDFSLRLQPEWKLKRLKLRWFFKEALKGFLPNEILAKKKHGFGLPFGVWLMQHPRLRTIVLDSLASLRGRRIVNERFLDRLTKEYLPISPGYYGEMVWILTMLDRWMGSNRDRAIAFGATRP